MYFKKIDAFIMSLDNKASVGTCTCICKITIIPNSDNQKINVHYLLFKDIQIYNIISEYP